MKRFVLFLSLLLATASFSQDVNIVGSESTPVRVFSDTVLATSKILRTGGTSQTGWYKIGNYKYFSFWLTLVKPTGLANWDDAFAAGDSIWITYETFTSAASSPSSASTAFYESGDDSAKTLLVITPADTAHPYIFKSFHGSGDPELAPAEYIRFRYQVEYAGGLATTGIGLVSDLMRQP